MTQVACRSLGSQRTPGGIFNSPRWSLFDRRISHIGAQLRPQRVRSGLLSGAKLPGALAQ
ncbi:MAG: hypothetical protein A2V77_11465 [Anaeromyxobacter sp. RBG_16_69_14]|nr:MAG: hypothetical protein A2V77_11465 [Anaeromyxobacter sp. RBG_16_69_14]